MGLLWKSGLTSSVAELIFTYQVQEQLKLKYRDGVVRIETTAINSDFTNTVMTLLKYTGKFIFPNLIWTWNNFINFETHILNTNRMVGI